MDRRPDRGLGLLRSWEFAVLIRSSPVQSRFFCSLRTGPSSTSRLTWSDISIARTKLLQAMQDAQWPTKHLVALAGFFVNLDAHDIREEEGGELALVQYQAEVRCEWMDAVTGIGSQKPFNISVINEERLRRIVAKILHQRQLASIQRYAFSIELMVYKTKSPIPSSFYIPTKHTSPAPHCTSPAPHRTRLHLHHTSSASCLLHHMHGRHPRIEQRFSLTAIGDSPRKRKYHADPPILDPNAGASEAQASTYRDKRRKAGPMGSQVFRKGATTSLPLSACTLCLGRHPHNIGRCDTTALWDNTSLFCKWNDRGRLLHRDGTVLCSEWQLSRGCKSTSHPQGHLCSGCESSSHGAQECPRAQKTA